MAISRLDTRVSVQGVASLGGTSWDGTVLLESPVVVNKWGKRFKLHN